MINKFDNENIKTTLHINIQKSSSNNISL